MILRPANESYVSSLYLWYLQIALTPSLVYINKFRAIQGLIVLSLENRMEDCGSCENFLTLTRLSTIFSCYFVNRLFHQFISLLLFPSMYLHYNHLILKYSHVILLLFIWIYPKTPYNSFLKEWNHLLFYYLKLFQSYSKIKTIDNFLETLGGEATFAIT